MLREGKGPAAGMAGVEGWRGVAQSSQAGREGWFWNVQRGQAVVDSGAGGARVARVEVRCVEVGLIPQDAQGGVVPGW